MQQPLRPHTLRQPAASRLARPVFYHSGAQAQDSIAAIAENPVDRNPIPKACRDVPGSPSRLPAPKIPRLLPGDGTGIGGAKRSMLPQLSPTKGFMGVLEGGKRDYGRIDGDVDPSCKEKISPTLVGCNAVDDTRNQPLLVPAVYQNSKIDESFGNSSNQTRTDADLEDAPRQGTIMKQTDLTADPPPIEYASSRPRYLPIPKALSGTTGLGSKPPSSETKVVGSREMIAKSVATGRARPIRQPTTCIATMPSENTSRDTTDKPGLSIPTSVRTTTARPRPMVLNAGGSFTQETRPSSTSAGSIEPILSEKPDAKRQYPTNVGHRRTPSTRSTRTALSGKPKELEHKEAMPSSENAPTSTEEADVSVAQQKKPAFTTFQQHFTPRKVLKVPTSFGLATAAGKQPKGELISPELARLQTELLQLHILHKSSTEVSHAWRRSAESRFRKRFEDVAQKYRKMAILERKTQAQLNLRALKEFNQEGGAEQDLGERIQALGSVIPEIVDVTGAGGKYARLIRGFERWIEWIEQIWEARDHDGKALNSRGELEFVEGLGDGWRDEAAGLSRKLGLWLQSLDAVGSSPAGSSLALVVAHCKRLAEGMLQELEIMRVVEREVVARESRWVSEKAAELSVVTDAELVETDSILTEEGRRASTGKQGIWVIP